MLYLCVAVLTRNILCVFTPDNASIVDNSAAGNLDNWLIQFTR